jgi:hypothetical protein
MATSRYPASLTRANFRQHVAEWTAAACPSRGRDDAIGARLIAARLDAESERGAAREARRNRRAASAITVSKSLGCRQPRRLQIGLRRGKPNLGNKMILAAIGNELDDSRKVGDVIRSTGCITAGDDYSSVRIFPSDLSDDLAGALIGCACDRAGVDDHHIRVIGRCGGAAGRNQLLLDLKGVCLIDAASECDDGVLHNGD